MGDTTYIFVSVHKVKSDNVKPNPLSPNYYTFVTVTFI